MHEVTKFGSDAEWEIMRLFILYRGRPCFIISTVIAVLFYMHLLLNCNNALLAQVRVVYRAQVAIAAQASPNGNAIITMIFKFRNSRCYYRVTKLLDCTYYLEYWEYSW